MRRFFFTKKEWALPAVLLTLPFLWTLADLVAIRAVAASGQLSVKVIKTDEDGRVKLLLPMHQTTIEARLLDREAGVGVRVNKFYRAELVPGEVETTKQNAIHLYVGDGPEDGYILRFRILTIRFRGAQ